jgi:hypothetical protein
MRERWKPEGWEGSMPPPSYYRSVQEAIRDLDEDHILEGYLEPITLAFYQSDYLFDNPQEGFASLVSLLLGYHSVFKSPLSDFEAFEATLHYTLP